MQRKKYCLLSTFGDHGVSSRVLQPFPPGPALDIWFGTGASSRKVAELRADPRATVAYEDDGKSACVVLTGRVQVVDSLEVRRSRFTPTWWAFWPEGPESDDFILLHFVPERIEVWDAGRGITPEPFGLRAAGLVLQDGEWRDE